MKSSLFVAMGLVVLVCAASWTAVAQQSAAVAPVAAAGTATAVPNLINYSGVLKDTSGHTLTSLTGVTFLLYKDEQGGAPLWLETQNVQPDKTGHYTVQLGATSASGLPVGLFVSGEARWLAVQVAGEGEQTRVMLVAVPYAMKAGDAETVGGLPPSAFVLAAPPASAATVANSASTPSSAAVTPLTTSDVTTTGGTANTIPMFTTATNIQNSILTQTGTTAINVGGKLNSPATGTATSAGGKNSQPHDFVASSYSSSGKAAVAQTFQFQAEPAGNDTATPSGTLNLLYGSGAATPTETGLKINSKGQFTFAAGQTFPGTGSGTVKSVALAAPATDFTVSGSPVTGTGTLSFAWKVAPTNADTANAIVKRDASGNFSAGTVSVSALASTGGISGSDIAATGTVSAGTVSATAVNATNATLTGELLDVTSDVTAVNTASTSANATTIFGAANATTGEGWGVEGVTLSSASNAYGVYGLAEATSGSPIGVYGQALSSSLGIGVWGQNKSESTTGSGLSSAVGAKGVGVWGDGGATSGNFGVVGSVDDGTAGVFINNSPGGAPTLYVQAENSASTPFIVDFDATPNFLGKYCEVDSSGDLSCTGSKSAVVPVDGGQRIVAMSAIESPKNWFEDFGSAELVNGKAVVTLDPTFIQTVNTEMDYRVFPVPNGDCKGLYVTNKTATSFEVRELGGGTSSVAFDYRITALRKNYENIRFADHTHDLDGMKKMLERAKMMHEQPQSHDPQKKLQPAKAASLQPEAAAPLAR